VDSIKYDKNVKKVFLFGSFAYGKPTADSDYDIAVLSTLTGDDIFENAIDLMMDIGNKIIKPYDLIVFNEDDFYKSTDRIFGIEEKILKEGILLYESHQSYLLENYE